MKLFSLIIVLTFLLLGCQTSINVNNSQSSKDDTLYQYSTLATLLQGVYDGNISVGELKEQGDFGLGTFNSLNGEMLMLDNVVYQIAADGVAREMSDDIKMPFAAVTHFKADKTFTLSQTISYVALQEAIDARLPTKNIAYAIKIEGLFSYLKTRSEAKQSQPYEKLVEVLKEQKIFEFSNQKGTMVGFRLPSYMSPANAAGYHLHFLTEDKKSGGHLLECQTQDVRVEIDYMHKWETHLPYDSEFYEANITNEKYE